MSTFNDIGISRQLDRNRIRKLFIIGLVGGIMTFIGDWLLGCGVFGYMLFAACDVHVPCLSTVFFYKHMMRDSPDHAYDLTVKFGLYFLLSALILFLVFFIIMSAAQISAETLYAFAPSYAESYRKAGTKCMIHVGKGMHHCYAMQYFIPGCKPAFDEVMRLIQNHFKKERSQ